MKTTTSSEYDTYIGWKNRGRQVMKGEHSEPNHLGERVFHVDQTMDLRIGRHDRFTYPGGRRIAYTDFDPDDEDLFFRLAYDPNY